MAKDVTVNINLEQPVASVGFGYPLILNGFSTPIPYTECYSFQEVQYLLAGVISSDTEEQIAAKIALVNENAMYKAAELLYMQETVPEKVALFSSTVAAVTSLPALVSKGWRQLIVLGLGGTGASTRKDISDYIETTKDKLYFTAVDEVADLSDEDNNMAGNSRTVCIVYNTSSTTLCAEAALVGATAGKTVGSITYKNQHLVGLDGIIHTDAEINAAHAAHAMLYTIKCGVGVTSEGKTMSDEYIDIIDAEDYIVQSIEYQTQMLLINADKIPYDNSGIARLENVCINVLKDAANNGIIAETDEGVPDYSVSYKARSETKASDRAIRKYIEGHFSFALAGAIHTVVINGTITI